MSKPKNKESKHKKSFTIVELLIVIVVIGILTTITVLSYRDADLRAQDAKRKGDLKSVMTRIELYAIEHDGIFPITTSNTTANWKSIDVRTDDNCFNGSSQADWVPNIGILPQSTPNIGINAGVGGNSGCYIYASNGNEYILSAWNMLSVPQTSTTFYRRQGFRSFQTPTSAQFYSCNENAIGGISMGNYDIDKDYYKHSYTISNVACNETPPSGV
jgi:type II secretory pathway pseudopilin PulG